jgi:hypothetical protein
MLMTLAAKYTHTHTHIHTYTYRERERENRKREALSEQMARAISDDRGAAG